MAGTYTTYKYLYLPQTSGDAGIWGSLLNEENFPLIDAALGGYTAISVSSSNVVLSNTQDQMAILRISGTMSANIAVTSACQGSKIIENLTTGNFTLTVNTGVGTPLVLTQNSSSLVIFDSTNGPRNGVTPQSLSGVLSKSATNQSITGGAVVTSYALSTGSFTANPGLSPLQYITNNGAFTITAPASDGTMLLLITNGASASTITFTGFTVGSSTGDTIDFTNGHMFMVSIMRVNGYSTYRIAAMQ